MFGRKVDNLNRYRIGLALSGGGTKGFAHIGVFKALQEQGIKISCVAGTSAGSIFGAMFCAGIDCDTMIAEGKKIRRRDILNSPLVVGSKADNIAKAVRKVLPETTFDQLKIPFCAVAVDIVTGEEIVLNSGDVATAVSASSAVPAIFTHVNIDGHTLVDGGLLNNMPSDVCRKMGAEVVIGVDLNYARGKGTTSNRLLDTLLATWSITTKSTMYKGTMNSDILFTPELSEYKNTSLNHIDEMVEEGYRAAMEKMPELLALLNTKF